MDQSYEIIAQAARRGTKGKKNSADLAARRESVVRELLESRNHASDYTIFYL
ncbi:MAG: hypothetical protein ACRD7E_08230 [Bryobacteraceae bacterium]